MKLLGLREAHHAVNCGESFDHGTTGAKMLNLQEPQKISGYPTPPRKLRKIRIWHHIGMKMVPNGDSFFREIIANQWMLLKNRWFVPKKQSFTERKKVGLPYQNKTIGTRWYSILHNVKSCCIISVGWAFRSPQGKNRLLCPRGHPDKKTGTHDPQTEGSQSYDIYLLVPSIFMRWSLWSATRGKIRNFSGLFRRRCIAQTRREKLFWKDRRRLMQEKQRE